MKPSQLVAILALCFVVTLLVSHPVAIADSTTVVKASLTQMPVERQIEFRRSIGFRSDVQYVQEVEQADDSVIVEEMGGVPLTVAEAEELRMRMDLEESGNALVSFFESHPKLREAYGGIYLEHSAGSEDFTSGGYLVL